MKNLTRFILLQRRESKVYSWHYFWVLQVAYIVNISLHGIWYYLISYAGNLLENTRCNVMAIWKILWTIISGIPTYIIVYFNDEFQLWSNCRIIGQLIKTVFKTNNYIMLTFIMSQRPYTIGFRLNKCVLFKLN